MVFLFFDSKRELSEQLRHLLDKKSYEDFGKKALRKENYVDTN